MNAYLMGSRRIGIPLPGARKFELGLKSEEFAPGGKTLTGTSGNADAEAVGIGANRTARKFLGCTRAERLSPRTWPTAAARLTDFFGRPRFFAN